MDIGQAINYLKVEEGKVSRSGWNGKGMWITYSPGHENLAAERIWSPVIRQHVLDNELETVTFRPYIMMKTADDEFIPWICSQSDLLATDWFPL